LSEETQDNQSAQGAQDKQPFTQHLNELRRRITVSVVAVLVGFIACFQYSEYIFEWLMLPMRKNIELDIHKSPYLFLTPREKVHDLVFLAPAESFWVHMKIALIAGIIITAPILFWQLWRFISPGLHSREKRLAVPFVFVTSLLFITGSSFCFLVVLPFAMQFLLEFKTQSLVPMISVEKYMDFCLKFILAFGIVFELPVVIVFLTRMGIVSPDTLAKNRKYAVLFAFILAAILTPTPDAFNQTLMAVPIIILYEAGILASRIFALRRKAAKAAEESRAE